MTTEDDKKNKSNVLNTKDFTPEELETIKKLTPEDWEKISRRAQQMFTLIKKVQEMSGQDKTKH